MESSNFFAPFMVSISVAYFGGRGNRAKWVAVASIITWLSAIVFAMIYFNYEIIKIEAIQKGEFFSNILSLISNIYVTLWLKELRIV